MPRSRRRSQGSVGHGSGRAEICEVCGREFWNEDGGCWRGVDDDEMEASDAAECFYLGYERLREALTQVANWAERHQGKADADIALGYLKAELRSILASSAPRAAGPKEEKDG